jgi:hypothetical protein
MDPFSIVVGVTSLVDVCWRVGKYLRDVQHAAKFVEGEIASLLHEINALDAVNNSIKLLHETEIGVLPPGSLDKVPDGDRELWRNTARDLRNCEVAVEKLYDTLLMVAGKHGEKVAGWRDGFTKQMRKHGKDGELNQIRLQLIVHRESLHISLTMLNL